MGINTEIKIKQYRDALEKSREDMMLLRKIADDKKSIQLLNDRTREYVLLSSEYCGYLRALVDTCSVDYEFVCKELIAQSILFDFDREPGCCTVKIL